VLARDMGIDLGTANVIVFVRGRGIVLREPSVVALDKESGRLLAIGQEARRMVGRTPGNVVALRPLKDGVIADYGVTAAMLSYFLRRASGRTLLRPQVVVCVPSGVTIVERRAIRDACLEAGAKRVFIVSEPMAAAIGAGLDVTEPRGNMVVDIGGGTTDVAVISLGAEVVSASLRVAGDKMDEAIARYVRREFNLVIGERTAEEVKMAIGWACPPPPDASPAGVEVRGRDAVTGLPRTETLTPAQAYEALAETVQAIVNLIRSVLERTPPELSADVMDRGIVLTGGGSLLKGLPELLARETGVPVHLVDDPLSCVALGTGRILDMLDRPSTVRLLVAESA